MAGMPAICQGREAEEAIFQHLVQRRLSEAVSSDDQSSNSGKFC